MQAGFPSDGTVNFDLGWGVPLEASIRRRSTGLHPGYQLVERRFGAPRSSCINAQRFCEVISLPPPQLGGAAKVFSRLIDIEGMMCVLSVDTVTPRRSRSGISKSSGSSCASASSRRDQSSALLPGLQPHLTWGLTITAATCASQMLDLRRRAANAEAGLQ